MGRVLLISIISLTCLFSSLNAEQLPTAISRVSYDRLYFTQGSEALIYNQCPFYIVKKSDTIYSGKIENVILGVSYSYPTNHFFDTLDIKKLRAIIVTADIDSLSPISISIGMNEYTDLLDIIYRSSFSSLEKATNNFTGRYGNILELIRPGRYNNLLSGTPASIADLTIRYTSLEQPGNKTIPVPYIAVLMPNPTHQVNDKNYLSSSLYYRFDPSKLSFMFDGTHTAPVDCLYPADSGCNRDYEFDPVRGKNLLTFLHPAPREISLAVSHPSLLPAARYFADVLSRDRIKINIIEENNNADLTLRYIPYVSDKPETGLQYLVSLLQNNPLLSNSQKEELRQLQSHSSTIQEVVSTNFRRYYFNLIDYSLKYNFGVFPLFQPSLSITTQSTLKTEQAIGDNGIIDFTKLTKIKLPANSREIRK